ncbi:hydrolase [Alkalilimnicola sp. S0819]|nr:hydrolase [Alkalilimnicola sp. S0819]MPQ15352.1 hydrolase [Alkalilimnicola sp. S0819]
MVKQSHTRTLVTSSGVHDSDFQPPPWLRNPHLQTLWPALLRRRPRLRWQPETLELPDGDCLQLLWGPQPARPRVLLLHGLGGNCHSQYIAGLAQRLDLQGFCPVVMHNRGVGMANRHDRFYHAGAAEDLDAAARRLLLGQHRLSVVGFSLGGSILLNWLAAQGAGAPLEAAVAVSVPYDLGACADALERGFARIYQADLLRSLKRLVRRKFAGRTDAPVDLAQLSRLRSLREFDEQLTAPLHGFENAADYYERCSTRDKLRPIRCPTLLLQALDDPFVPRRTLPDPRDLPETVRLESSPHGGHVGFVGHRPGDRRYWLDERIARFLRAPELEAAQANSGPAVRSNA